LRGQQYSLASGLNSACHGLNREYEIKGDLYNYLMEKSTRRASPSRASGDKSVVDLRASRLCADQAGQEGCSGRDLHGHPDPLIFILLLDFFNDKIRPSRS